MKETVTLLIIDDDADDREMFIEVVTEINSSANCLKANSGHESLELLKTLEVLPDFIFLDLNMQRMSGRQCLEHLKKCDRTKAIPVIIYTTSNLEEDKIETNKLGAEHFITKPSSLEALKKELESVLSYSWANVK